MHVMFCIMHKLEFGYFHVFNRCLGFVSQAFLDPQTSSTYKKNQTVSMDEVKAICPPVNSFVSF